MSIATLKKKVELRHRSLTRSTTQAWVSHSTRVCSAGDTLQMDSGNSSSAGFSLNGGSRAVRGIGARNGISSTVTPYHGIYAKGYGGHGGAYESPPPIWGAGITTLQLRANQSSVIAPTVLSSGSHLRRRNRSLTTGPYPCSTTQQIFTGNQSDNTSAGSYIERLAARHRRDGLACPNASADVDVYGGTTATYTTTQCGSGANAGDGNATSSCRGKLAGRRGNVVKSLNHAMTSKERTAQIGRTCGQIGYAEQPYPGPKNTSAGCNIECCNTTNKSN